MPMVYTSSLATAGNSACHATPGTETRPFTIKYVAAGRSVAVQAAYVIGKGAGLTSISGIVFRITRCTTATASTGGVATTPSPKDAGMAAATGSAFTGTTAADGAGRTNHVIFGCGAAGPGGWVAPNPDSMVMCVGNATPPGVDLVAAS